jgi:hypothetical protein
VAAPSRWLDFDRKFARYSPATDYRASLGDSSAHTGRIWNSVVISFGRAFTWHYGADSKALAAVAPPGNGCIAVYNVGAGRILKRRRERENKA